MSDESIVGRVIVVAGNLIGGFVGVNGVLTDVIVYGFYFVIGSAFVPVVDEIVEAKVKVLFFVVTCVVADVDLEAIPCASVYGVAKVVGIVAAKASGVWDYKVVGLVIVHVFSES